MPTDNYTIDTRQFSRATRKFMTKTGGRFEKKLRAIALAVVREVVLLQTERGAVDTGLSRANWQTRVGTVTDYIVSKETDPNESAAANLAQIPNFGIGQIIFIYNNVEYTIYLEFGTEKMAPRAMLRDGLGRVAMRLS